MIRAIRVINAFCQFLGIRCLVIPNPDEPVLPTTTITNEEAESLLFSSPTTYNSV
jgi:hypothetical protein